MHLTEAFWRDDHLPDEDIADGEDPQPSMRDIRCVCKDRFAESPAVVKLGRCLRAFHNVRWVRCLIGLEDTE